MTAGEAVTLKQLGLYDCQILLLIKGAMIER